MAKFHEYYHSIVTPKGTTMRRSGETDRHPAGERQAAEAEAGSEKHGKSREFWSHVKYGERGINQPWFHRLNLHKQRK